MSIDKLCNIFYKPQFSDLLFIASFLFFSYDHGLRICLCSGYYHTSCLLNSNTKLPPSGAAIVSSFQFIQLGPATIADKI